jgi:hypothetical protein
MGRRTLGRGALRLAVQGAIVGALVVGAATPAFAAKQTHGGRGGGSTTTGNDVSWPNCASALPPAPAFGIVGVNGGLANDLNACFGPSTSYPSYTQSELYWAVASATGVTNQPRASLYVNTADPGNMYNGSPISDWPTSSSESDQYGPCTDTTVTSSSGTTYTVGENSTACAWQYGYNKAAQDATWLTSAAEAINSQQSKVSVDSAPGGYPWWLDVETGNTWQTGTSGQAMNVADLQGMIAALQAAGVTTVGAYSTTYQWDTITGGTTSASGSLYDIPDWIPGARNLSQAKSNCNQTPFTGATAAVTVTQWTGQPDNDYACP